MLDYNNMKTKYIIAGAGLFGCVIAERIATVLKSPVEIFESRNHVGGNCNSFIDNETGIECHQYGCHIFHTSIPEVWEYVNNFDSFTQYRHRVLTKYDGKVYSMPINLFSINKLFYRELSPAVAEKYIKAKIAASGMEIPRNLEEKAISLAGKELYDVFVKGYTEKQWGRRACDLPEEIITRLPVRYSYNPDYFDDPWQGLPLNGYAEFFRRLLDNPLIETRLNTPYALPPSGLPDNTILVYTGMPDKLFGYRFGPLEWRSLKFKWRNVPVRDFQGIGQMNYADGDVPFTRIHEFKHYHPERKEAFACPTTSLCLEYPADYEPGGEAYYPVNDARNNQLYERYAREASKIKGLYLGGRLGSFKYWNMDKTIANALKTFADICGSQHNDCIKR